MVYLFRVLYAIIMIIIAVFIRPILLLLLDVLWSLKPHGLKYYWSYAGDFLFDEWFIKDVIYFIKNGYGY